MSPASGYYPGTGVLRDLPRKNTTNLEGEEEMGAEVKCLWVVLSAPACAGRREQMCDGEDSKAVVLNQGRLYPERAEAAKSPH